ncbi:long-chain fatty acid--CoA ligase [Streptomyces albus subsp. chlorinus]|nr:AMP-binding protein [Streptomyces albus]NSC22399.1 long-chain fatty acid--CoA ligase [Streptomyces albus subsp. chlorinus]
MQDFPLTVTRLLVHGALAHGTSRVTTWAGRAGGAEPDRRTFLESAVRAMQLAGALHDAFGIRPGDTVATLMANTADHLEAYLAVPSMGAVLHTLDPWLPADQLVEASRRGGARVLLTDPTGLAPLASVLPRLPHLRHVVVAGSGGTAAVVSGTACGAEVHDYELLIGDRPQRYDWPEIDERDAAVLCHTTSRADGVPRGVAYSHRALYLHALQAQTPQTYGIGERDLVLPVVPMSRMLAWGLPYAAFAGGASLLLPGAYDQPAPLADMAERERPTLAVADPAVWDGLLKELEDRPRDLSFLREAVVVGGPGEEPAGSLPARELGRRHGISTAAAWGMPETLSPACVARAEADGDGADGARYRFPASVEYGVSGPDLAPLPWDGESQGELLLRGPWITASYVEDGTALLHEGWLRTGETATIGPDGRVALRPPKTPTTEGH